MSAGEACVDRRLHAGARPRGWNASGGTGSGGFGRCETCIAHKVPFLRAFVAVVLKHAKETRCYHGNEHIA